VLSHSVLPMYGYTMRFTPVVKPSDLDRCDVVVAAFPALDEDLAAAARRTFTGEETLHTHKDVGLIFRR
jgi:hypothetical protein